eukprot:365940-Chlamydomonas_euryale.AAC.30
MSIASCRRIERRRHRCVCDRGRHRSDGGPPEERQQARRFQEDADHQEECSQGAALRWKAGGELQARPEGAAHVTRAAAAAARSVSALQAFQACRLGI